MANARYSPTIRRRRLSAELKRIRHASRKGLEDIARTTEISRSTVGNIESGEKKYPKVIEVAAFLDACGMHEGPEREAILDLCRQARERGWWDRYKSVLSGQFIGFETEASVISNWEATVIPGLLQVPEYVELLARSSLVRNPKDIQHLVDARMKRQQILSDEPPDATFVFDETALLRLINHRQVFRSQVAHIIQLAEQPNSVDIQMTTAEQLNPGSAGSFVVMGFPNTADPSVVYLETDTDGLYLEEADEVARYRNLFTHLRLAALGADRTVSRLRELITENVASDP